MSMTLQHAQRILDATLSAAAEKKTQPLAVIVLDSGAHPVAFARQDGASLFRLDIARAKAHGALGMGADTRALAERAANNPVFFTTVAIAADGRLALSPGGVLIRDTRGNIIGAIGVSGDTGDIDEACALAGIEAAK